MQSIYPLSSSNFTNKAHQPINKLEITIGDRADSIDLCDFLGENYLIEFQFSSGQRELTYNPVAAEFTAIIDDTDGLFNPKNTDSPFYSFFKKGERVTFSTGFRIDGLDYLWQWFTGVVSEVSIDRANKQIILKGFDYTQYLIDKKIKSPDNYWGSSVTLSTVKDQADYDLPAACNWPYIAYLDGSPIYETDYWIYDQSTQKFWFLPSKIPASDGTDNLIVYYYTDQVPENVVADLLVAADLYPTQAAALAAMDYTATGETIEKVRFTAGTSVFNSIRKICERVDYIFYFKYDGTPVFKPIPSAGSSVFTFTADLVNEFHYLENIDEVRNHIVIEGDEYTIYDELRRILDGSEIQYTLDEIPDGTTWGRVALTGISAGIIVLAGLDAEVTDQMFTSPTNRDNIEAWRHTSDVTLIDGGKIYTGTVTLNKLSFTPFVIATDDLDDITNGATYGKVLNADMSAGHILLSSTVGDLDDIANGTTYGKVALTGISAGKIIVAGLDSGVTARMFLDSTTKTNIEAWRHASDVTLIDGGDIYTGTVTAAKIAASAITTDKLAASAVTAVKIAANTITLNKLTTGLSPNLIKSKYSDFQSFDNGDTIGYTPLNCTATCDTSEFYIGDRCLKVIGTDSTDEHVYLAASATDYNIRLKPSTKYIISLYAKTNVAPTAIRVYLAQDNGDALFWPATQNVTTSWARYEAAITTNASLVDSGYIWIKITTASRVTYFDAIQVEEASAATSPEASPYKPSGTVEIYGGQIEAASIVVGKLSFTPYVIGTNDLDDVTDGTSYSRVLTTDISAGHVLLTSVTGDLDDVSDGTTYGKVLVTDISSGHILLAQATGDLDDIADGTNYGKVALTDISSGHILLATTTGDIDDVVDGTTYGKILKADLSSGHVLLTSAVGDLDDITDGTTYGKVALTGITAGKIIVAGLDSGITARMFLDSTTKTNIEAWRHASDVTLIDGGDIYTGTVTAAKIAASAVTTDKLAASAVTAVKIAANTITLNKLTTGLSPNLIKSKYSDFQSFDNGDTIGYCGEGTATCDTSDFIVGDRCLNLLATAANNYLFLGSSSTDYNIRLKPSTKYIVSFYTRSNYAGYPFYPSIRQDDGVYKNASSQNTILSWKRYTFIITTDSNVTNSGVLVINNTNLGVQLFIDAIQVEEASAATSPEASPYKPSGTVEIYGGQIEAASIVVGKLSFTPYVIGTNNLDDVINGTTYSRVLTTDISAGHVLLSAVTGDLDDIANGTNYGKVALTGISAGKIVVAGLDSGITARMFLDSTTKTNIEAWRHASDVTLIDGGDIYANSITLNKLSTGLSPNLIKSKYSDFQSFANGDTIGYTPLNCTATCDTSEFYIGDRCLKVIGTDSTDEHVYLAASATDYNIRLKPSTKYIISLYAKTNVAPTAIRVYLAQDNGDALFWPATQNVTTSWARYEAAITTNASLVDSGYIWIKITTASRVTYFDAIQVEEASAATSPEASPYKPSGTVEIHGGQIEADTIVTGKLKVGNSGNSADTFDIYQGESDTQIFRLRSTSIDHQITQGGGQGYDWGTYTDCYYYMRKYDASLGGLHTASFTESTLDISYELYAVYGAASTAKDGTATGAINLAGLRADPTNHTYQAALANENIFCLKTKPTGGAYQAVFIVDEDGDVLYDGATSSFQHEDDIQLVKDLEDILSDKISKKQMKLKNVFKKHKVVHVNEVDEEKVPENPRERKLTGKKRLDRFISTKKLNMLLIGSILQLSEKNQTLEKKMNQLEARLN